MITKDQIPEAARSAAITERVAGGSASEVIAAALNAWPRARQDYDLGEWSMCLPFPQKDPLHMTPEQEALREKVARAMAAADGGPEGSTLFEIHMREFGDGYRNGADAAIAVVLKEAATLAGAQVTSGAVMMADGSRRILTEIDIEMLRIHARGKEAAILSLIPQEDGK